jgi:hypothetical protein
MNFSNPAGKGRLENAESHQRSGSRRVIGSPTCRKSLDLRQDKTEGLQPNPKVLQLASSCTDEAEEVWKNFLLSNLVKDEIGEEK